MPGMKWIEPIVFSKSFRNHVYRRTDGQTSGWIQYTPISPSVEQGYNDHWVSENVCLYSCLCNCISINSHWHNNHLVYRGKPEPYMKNYLRVICSSIFTALVVNMPILMNMLIIQKYIRYIGMIMTIDCNNCIKSHRIYTWVVYFAYHC